MKTALRLLYGSLLCGPFAAGPWTQLRAEPAPAAVERNLRSVSVLAGFGTANLKGQDDYERVPVGLRFSFDPAPTLRRLGMELPGSWALNLEPFFAQTFRPAPRQEVGCSLLLRFDQPLPVPGLAVYFEGGAGPLYMTLETSEQSTQFNFIDQAGAGLVVSLNAALDLELGYRFWHISNAGIRHPNSGINGHAVHVGTTVRF